MTLEIVGVRESGALLRERIVLRATGIINAGAYLILCTSSHEDGRPLSGPTIASFWMPDFMVSENDLIVLYTKEGIDTEKVNERGRKTYFFYWSEQSPLWTDRTSATLIKVSSFNHLVIENLEDEE